MAEVNSEGVWDSDPHCDSDERLCDAELVLLNDAVVPLALAEVNDAVLE